MDVSTVRRLLLGSIVLAVMFVRSLVAQEIASVKAGDSEFSPNSVGVAPVIDSFSVSVYNNNLYIWGHVTDTDTSPVGRPVYIWGTFSRSVVIDANNNFGVIIEIQPGTSGAVFAITSDTSGNVSGVVNSDFGN